MKLDDNSNKSEVGSPNDTVYMDYEQYASYKESCIKVLAKAKMAKKLSKNSDFIEIIMKDYFENEPKRLGSLMASGRLTPTGFDGAIEDLRSIGHLRSYLQDYIQKGEIARQELEDLEEAYKEANKNSIEEKENTTTTIYN